MKISTIKTSFCLIYYSLILAYSKRGFWSWCLTPLSIVFYTTSTVPSTANLQVVAACSVWLSVNTGSQSWGYWVDSVDIV
jgi:hypothetical protein